MVESAYIHIPFCRSKCHYCSFVSYAKEGLKSDYINALEYEIKSVYHNEELQTLYFGGGTPSLLSIQEFERIIKLFNIYAQTEITTELNPEGYEKNGLTQDYLFGIKNAGINRISIGAQTFNDNILNQINRRHNSLQIYQAIENAKQVQIKNISLDFIYGLPNQSAEMFLNDLKTALDLGVNHISLYGLSIEEGCYFYEHLPQNIADDELQAQMYIEGVKFLTSNGFNHYEFSNFAPKGYESKHNINYWNNSEYYGFGTAAHGYLNSKRYSHPNTIEEFIANPLKYISEFEETPTSKLEEEIFLGFRKMCGIDIGYINEKYEINFEEKYKKILNKYIKSDLMQKTTKGYALTLKGVLLSNSILSEFLE